MFSLVVVSECLIDSMSVQPAPQHEPEVLGKNRALLTWHDRPTSLVELAIGDMRFSLWADQVSVEHPVVLPVPGIAVTLAGDDRDYPTIAREIASRSGRSALQQIEGGEEPSYEATAARVRRIYSPTWLGLGRDVRLFALGLNSIGAGDAYERMWDWIAPQWHGKPATLAEAGDEPVRYQFMMGRGLGAEDTSKRRLRAGVFPVLEATRDDGPMRYQLTAFVAPEATPLDELKEFGTPFLIADGHSLGHTFTEGQQAEFDRLSAGYTPSEELVLYLRIISTNLSAVPRYAFLKAPEPHVTGADSPIHEPVDTTFDPVSGQLVFRSGRVAYAATLGGVPLSAEESATLLQPGSSLTLDVRLPHSPVSAERAAALHDRSFDMVLDEADAFWAAKLSAAAEIEVPEQRVNEMIAAGLLHLDLVSYGEEPHGTLAPTVGVYAPIGSESAPIMQFFDSAGRPDIAERSLNYFLDKQRDSGIMQNFGGYMLETEAALWSLGEHFRYTRDAGWAASVLPKIELAVGYILRNRESSRAKGVPFGLLVGKTADPDDAFASFMLNGYAVLGLSRAAEIAEAVDPGLAVSWRTASEKLREDVRAAFADAVAHSPVVPLGNGSWARTSSPWHGDGGPVSLRRDQEKWYTHGSFFVRDSLTGPLWLVLQEVIDPAEPITGELLDYAAEVLHQHNTAFSQPYYSPHPLIHLRRGEVNAFLTSYYTTFASLADPETYSFWEHYFHQSPHKTHEEAWFLMQTRWMLYLEDGNRLRLLPGVPRAWLAPGSRIHLGGVRSYFGPIDATVQVDASGDSVDVVLTMDPERAPAEVLVRLAHPTRRRASTVSAGRYDPATETLSLVPTLGRATARLRF